MNHTQPEVQEMCENVFTCSENNAETGLWSLMV